MGKKHVQFSDQIRKAIKDSGKTCYRISQETDIAEAALSRFMNRKGGLSMAALDRLAECIGLRAVLSEKSKSKKG